ncbi:unnamed protein product, partial [Tetraodon nigroviridis]
RRRTERRTRTTILCPPKPPSRRAPCCRSSAGQKPPARRRPTPSTPCTGNGRGSCTQRGPSTCPWAPSSSRETCGTGVGRVSARPAPSWLLKRCVFVLSDLLSTSSNSEGQDAAAAARIDCPFQRRIVPAHRLRPRRTHPEIFQVRVSAFALCGLFGQRVTGALGPPGGGLSGRILGHLHPGKTQPEDLLQAPTLSWEVDQRFIRPTHPDRPSGQKSKRSGEPAGGPHGLSGLLPGVCAPQSRLLQRFLGFPVLPGHCQLPVFPAEECPARRSFTHTRSQPAGGYGRAAYFCVFCALIWLLELLLRRKDLPVSTLYGVTIVCHDALHFCGTCSW